ncbi:LysR family transcriptional regulator [Vibrio crassostreae]|nr:LysR family transcriptional regulator [Vibrio crassostreae]CAK2704313.1 LysR family transcriptional regulator [Vibrio crassostreae]CAK2714415.1 LysR family transcriptional regulator [Vibrio crassostreae]CAK2716219.1 LysR family transcriptional regulator [Vibrio crassostreae]CAK2717397.1 LysR family transcriptional regulator [Vibrio crassostreae]
MLSIEQIHAFTLVYQHGSYSAAARAANKERSTIREQVVTLEDIVGVELFQIEGRKAKPTDAAHQLISRATNLSKQAKDFELTAFSLLDEPLEKLIVMHDDQIPSGWISSAIMEIKQQFPQLTIDIICASRKRAYDYLEKSKCHIAIMATENSPRTQARIDTQYIGNLALGAYVSPDSLLAAQDIVSIEQLRLETQFELSQTKEGDLGCFRVSNTIEKVSSLTLASALLTQGGWIALSCPLAESFVQQNLLQPLLLNEATRNYMRGVCLFFGLSSNNREEIRFSLECFNRHAHPYLM